MQERLLGFIDALRQAGLTPSVSESLDAARAVAQAGIERPVLRECLAATLVKDHAERMLFDQVFDRYFAAPRRARTPGERRQAEAAGEGGGGAGVGVRRAAEREGQRGEQQRERQVQRPRGAAPEPRAAEQLAQQRALSVRPFRDMGPRDTEALRALVEALARQFRRRCARRMRQARRGRLDMRRTIRRALSRGGVPMELLLRRPRPGKSDLVALVDLSFSTATAAQFLLALLVPARPFFRRVTLLGYVDAPVEISVEGGHVVPHAPLDLAARSDFGNVLRLFGTRFEAGLGRNTVLLVLGDARNNRRPPRADLLARLQRAVRAVVWLNPEPPARWNTGDSVMATYARYASTVLAAHDPRTLDAALAQLVKMSL